MDYSQRMAVPSYAPALTMSRPDRGLRLLAVGGVASLLGYIAFFLLLQSKTLWARPMALPGGEQGVFGAIRKLFPTDWLNAERNSSLGLLNAGLYLLVLVWLFGVYWIALRKVSGLGVRQERKALWIVLGVAASVMFLLLWTPGTMSADLHNYIWYGRIWAVFGDNPFIHVPQEYAGRDMGNWLSVVYWSDVPSVYGPVWVWLAGAIAWIAQLLGGDISLHLLGHKVVAGLAHLANTLLVWRIAGYGVPSSEYRAPSDSVALSSVVHRLSPVHAALVYGWNPLVLIEFGANGHNDALMLSGVLVGLWLYVTGRWRLGVVAMALAVMVKATGLFFLLCYVGYLLWRSIGVSSSEYRVVSGGRVLRTAYCLLRVGGQAAALALGTWVVCYVPFWVGPQTLQPLWGGPAGHLFTNSLASLVRYKGAEGIHNVAVAQGWEAVASQSVEAIRVWLEAPLRWVVLPVTGMVVVWQLWRARLFERMLNSLGWILFAYLTVGAVWFWPWYVSWLVVPVALLGDGRLVRAGQILCATSLINYALYPQLAMPFSEVLFYRALFTIAPPLGYAVVATWWAKDERRGT